jgi:opacity protein-like surface antigen
MKKIILSLALLSSAATSALGSEGFYVKGGIGGNTIRPIKVKSQDLSGKVKLAHEFPLLQAGAGYSWNDRLRSEVMFDHFSRISSRERLIDKNQTAFNINTKTKISALMFNSYVDVLKFDAGSLFVGGGVGVVNKKESACGHAGLSKTLYPIPAQHSKQKNKFAYKLTAGIDLKTSDKFNAELSYNFYNLGRNNPPQTIGNIVRKRSYLVHNVTLGIRYYL